MKALTGNSAERQALLDEYQIALRMWSETKVLYPLESAEFAEATGHLDQLEQDLVLAQLHGWQKPGLQPA